MMDVPWGTDMWQWMFRGTAELPQFRKRVAIDVVVLQGNARQGNDLIAGPVVTGGIIPFQKSPVQKCAQMAGNRTDAQIQFGGNICGALLRRCVAKCTQNSKRLIDTFCAILFQAAVLLIHLRSPPFFSSLFSPLVFCLENFKKFMIKIIYYFTPDASHNFLLVFISFHLPFIKCNHMGKVRQQFSYFTSYLQYIIFCFTI